MAWRIQLKFGIGGAHPEEIFTEKFMCFSVKLQSQNSTSFAPVKYTFVCHVPQVSWAAQYTTLCLMSDQHLAEPDIVCYL